MAGYLLFDPNTQSTNNRAEVLALRFRIRIFFYSKWVHIEEDSKLRNQSRCSSMDPLDHCPGLPVYATVVSKLVSEPLREELFKTLT